MIEYQLRAFLVLDSYNHGTRITKKKTFELLCQLVSSLQLLLISPPINISNPGL